MPQKDRKGAPKASATMRSSKAGFDTYDDKMSQSSSSDSVTVVRKNSDLGKIASDNYKRVKKEYSKFDTDRNASVGIDSAAKTIAGIFAEAKAKSKTRGPQSGDHKFFKHTQKDNK